MTGVFPETCPDGVTHTISLLLRLEEQEMKEIGRTGGGEKKRCYFQQTLLKVTVCLKPEDLEKDLEYLGAASLTG